MTPTNEPSDADLDRELSRVQTGIFASLLKGHSMFLWRSRAKQPALSERLRNLLDGFGKISERVAESDHARFVEHREVFGHLLNGHAVAMEEYRRQQESRADDFNLLEVLQITYKEIRHSMVLAWLLDHDMRNCGTHAQGPLGFRLFLRELGLPESYADCRYRVRREAGGDESIVDIEVACQGRFLIHIENKVRSGEGADQTKREWADVQRRAATLGLDATGGAEAVHALFLSPRGTRPVSPHFRAITWGRVVRALERFAKEAKPTDVRLFAAHYARALRRFIVARTTTNEEDHGDGTVE